ncbi:MAG: PorV/PorQ family protein [Candidatus Latescibacterota bacterium]
MTRTAQARPVAGIAAPAASLLRTAVLWGCWLVSLALGLLPAAAGAQSGLPFLRLGAGARSAGLAEAGVALPDVDAAASNPAALQARDRRVLSLAHTAWIQDIRHDHLGVLFSGPRQAWAITGQLAQAEDLERRTGPTAQPLGTFGVYEGVLALSHARLLAPRLRAGATVKLLRQSIATQAASGVAADLGLLFLAGDGMQLGASARNLGRMADLGQQASPLPRSLRLGAAYAGLGRLLLAGEVERTRGSSTALHVGAEAALHELLVLRGGYQTAGERGLSAGVGVSLRRWTVDYAFVPFDAGLGEAHQLGVQLHPAAASP